VGRFLGVGIGSGAGVVVSPFCVVTRLVLPRAVRRFAVELSLAK